MAAKKKRAAKGKGGEKVAPVTGHVFKCTNCPASFKSGAGIGKHFRDNPKHRTLAQQAKFEDNMKRAESRKAARESTGLPLKRGTKFKRRDLFCRKCGTATVGSEETTFCGKCGLKTSPEWRFCPGCGAGE